MDIYYINRATGRKEKEKVYGGKLLWLLYRWFPVLVPLIAQSPWISRLYALFQKSFLTRYKVPRFIRRYEVDAAEFASSDFSSFNDFFTRSLKLGARPIASSGAVLPADARYLIFPDLAHVKRFYIKNQHFDLERFVACSEEARLFAGGALVIARLCPSDYHRFHFSVAGTPGVARPIEGALYSVNPLALAKRPSIMWENRRVVTPIDSLLFGKVLVVEIGATFVGAIHQTYTPHRAVEKGEEKGYFSFGGSCIALLFQKGAIEFAPDLLQPLEVRGLMGQVLGEATGRFSAGERG
jgi:phosphatidylserine decarboxylase